MEVSARVKFLWMLVAIFVVWQVFRIPVVLDAFLTFCTAGVIPGVHGVLSPEAVARLLIALFTLSFLLIFRAEIIASLPHRQKSVRVQVFAEQLPGKQVAVAPRKHPNKMLRSKTPKVHADRLYRKAGRRARTGLHRIKTAVIYVAQRVLFVSKRFISWGWPLVRLAAVVTAYKTRRVCTIVWRFVEPGIRATDRFIDKKLHDYKPTAEALEIAAVCWSTLIEIGQKVSRHARRSMQE